METPDASHFEDENKLTVSETDSLVNGDAEKEKIFLGCIPSSMFNVLLLGIFFMVLFTSFAPTQNFQTTINKKWGFWSLSVLYVVFALSNFIAPMILYKLGEKFTLALGGLMYLIYVASNALFSKYPENLAPVLLICAGMTGFGAAIIWTAQGAYVSKNSKNQTMGRNNGIFFGIFQVHQAAGNLLAQVLSNSEMAYPILFTILVSIGSVGFLGFFTLRPPPEQKEDTVKSMPLSERVRGVFKILSRPKMYMMVFIFIFSGFSHSYVAGKYTEFVGKQNLGYAMSVFGMSNAISSFIVGKSFDKLGSKIILIISSALIIAPTVMILLLGKSYFQDHVWIVYFCAVLMGISDSGFNSLLGAVLGIMFSDNLGNAFGAYKFVQSATGAVSYFIGPYIDMTIATLILHVLLYGGIICFVILDLFIESTDRKKDK